MTLSRPHPKGSRVSTTVYLALGANLGEAKAALDEALARIDAADLRILRRSRLYRSAPVGPQDQPAFFNAVVEAQTTLDPHPLLARLKDTEAEMGRTPTRRWGPRVIDLDIILFGDTLLDTPDLVIPHRELSRRAFVLAPLSDLCPEAVVPGLQRTVSALLEALPRQQGDLEALQDWG